MTPAHTQQLLDRLVSHRAVFNRQAGTEIERVLRKLRTAEIREADSLIQYHESLLFLRAYPQTSAIIRETERQLREFPRRVAQLLADEVDLSNLEHPEMSGIAGLAVIDTFSFDIVRWLCDLYPMRSAIDWDWFEDENRLGETWPRFMPLLDEDAFVEANIPFREWLRAARNGDTELAWLIERFKKLPLTDRDRAQLYNSQKLYVSWRPPYKVTRTGMRLSTGRIFYHQAPLIQRRDVDFRREIEKPSPPLTKLSATEGKSILDMTRAASTVRYRELYGFTHGDPRRVFKVNIGRGTVLYITELPPDKRLPLRAYHSAMIFKNHVPVGYFEGLSFFERMESGFNLYYTFREGETAWLYAQVLNVMRHLLGVTVFSLDPYQVGHENEEGIASGAFWFYRKLGFRPTRRALLRLAEQEEERIGGRKNYRTTPATLRKLAAGPMVIELNAQRAGDWDQFQIRNLGLATQRKMSSLHHGDANQMRKSAVIWLRAFLSSGEVTRNEIEQRVFSDFATLLESEPSLQDWTISDKQLLSEIIKAKAGASEERYLRLLQQHKRLRETLITMGSQDVTSASSHFAS